MLKILLFILLIGCSVSEDDPINQSNNENIVSDSDSVSNTQTDSSSQTSDNNEFENDLDGDFIPDDLEESLSLSSIIPNQAKFKTYVESMLVLEGGIKKEEFSILERDLVKDYVKLMTLGRGNISNYNFIKRSVVLGTNIRKPTVMFDDFKTCGDKCDLSLSVKVGISESQYFKRYENFEVSIKYYNTLTQEILDIDTRVLKDDMGKPIKLNLSLDSGVMFQSSKYKIRISESIYKNVLKGDYLLLVGLSNISFQSNNDIVTLFDLDQRVETNNKRIVLLADGNVYEYISHDQDYLLSQLFNNKSHEFKFNEDDIFSVNEVSNTMTSWDGITEIEEKNYLNGVWKISNAGLSLDNIENQDYFISYITNLDRLKLADKTYRSYEVTSETLDKLNVKPFESLQIRLKKNHTRYKEEKYSGEFTTKIAARGSEKCFKTKRVFNDSCCGGGGVRIQSSSFDKSSCCGARTICVDKGYDVRLDSYTCNVNKVKISSYTDNSVFDSVNDFKIYLSGNLININDLFYSEKSKSSDDLLLYAENNSFKNYNEITIDQPTSSYKLNSGYLSDDCLSEKCSQLTRWNKSCLEKHPNKTPAAKESKTEIKNINFEVIHKEIFERL